MSKRRVRREVVTRLREENRLLNDALEGILREVRSSGYVFYQGDRMKRVYDAAVSSAQVLVDRQRRIRNHAQRD